MKMPRRPRRERISIFAINTPLRARPIKHHACKSEARAATLFAGYSADAPAKGWRVVWHLGNLKHHSYEIKGDSATAQSRPSSPSVAASPVVPATRLDKITKRHTAFASFSELLAAPGYTPSLNVAVPELGELADAYDAAANGRTAHRYRYRREPSAA